MQTSKLATGNLSRLLEQQLGSKGTTLEAARACMPGARPPPLGRRAGILTRTHPNPSPSPSPNPNPPEPEPEPNRNTVSPLTLTVTLNPNPNPQARRGPSTLLPSSQTAPRREPPEGRPADARIHRAG